MLGGREDLFAITQERERREAVERDLNLRLRQQEATAWLGDLALRSKDLQTLLDAAARLVCETLEMEFCKVLELLPGGKEMLLRSGVGWQEGLVGSATVGVDFESQAGYTLRSLEPTIVHDLGGETRFEGSELLRAHGVVSGMSVIIPGRELPFGVLGVHTKELRAFVPHDTRFIKAVASILGSAVERFRAEDELRRSRDELSIILQGVSEGVTVQDRTGRLVYVNTAAAHQMGYETPTEVLEANMSEIARRFQLLDDGGSPITYDRLPGRQVLEGAPRASARVRFREVSTGQDRWSVVDATPVYDTAGRPVQAINIFRDITDLVLSERHNRFLAEAGSLLAASLDPRTTLTNLAQMAVTNLADWCSVLLVGDTGEFFQVAAHRDPDLAQMAREYQNRYPVDLDRPGGVGDVLRGGEPQYFPNITDEMLVGAARDEEHLRLMRELGMTSAITAPLKARDRVFGAITLIWSDSRRRYTEAEKDLATELARRASMAIENARLYEQAQALNAELERRVAIRTEQLENSNRLLAQEFEQHRMTSQALQKSEALLNRLFESAPDAMILVNAEGGIVRVNAQAEKLLGYSRGALAKKSIEELIPARYRSTHAGSRGRYFRDRVTRSMGRGLELFALNSTGEEIPVDIMLSPVDSEQGELTICAIRDITEQKRLQSELAETHRRLFESVEAERLSISQELHDGPIQDLYGLNLTLEGIRQALEIPEERPEMMEARESVQNVIQSLRLLCGELRPPMISHFGVEKAIRSHLNQARDKHPELQFHAELESDGKELSERARLALYRVYQNAVNNVIRHAQAQNVTIQFRMDDGHVRLVVQDDGRGFTPPQRWVDLAREGHFGLVGMTERVEAIGGRMEVRSAPGEGTTIEVTVPLQTARQN